MSNPNNMSLERLGEILDAFGASPNRWPADERTAAVLLLDGSEPARRAHAGAMHLDVVLDQASAAPPSPELVKRIHGLKPSRPAMAGWLFGRNGPRGPAAGWLQPAAFAMTAVIGIFIGLAIPRGDTIMPAPPAGLTDAAPTLETALDPTLIDGGLAEDFQSDPLSNSDTGEPDGDQPDTGPLNDIPLI